MSAATPDGKEHGGLDTLIDSEEGMEQGNVVEHKNTDHDEDIEELGRL